MSGEPSVDDAGFVSRDRVCTVLQGVLRAAQAQGWTDDALEQASGVKARTIKSYRVDCKQPSLAAVLSLAVVLGPQALNPLLALIGYTARPLDEADELRPNEIVAGCMRELSVLAEAAADGRFDHTEMPRVTDAADAIIATVLPIARAGRAA